MEDDGVVRLKMGGLIDFFRRRRLEMGLSVRQMASQAGLSYGHLLMLEQGKRANPTIETLLALARVADVNLEVTVYIS